MEQHRPSNQGTEVSRISAAEEVPSPSGESIHPQSTSTPEEDARVDPRSHEERHQMTPNEQVPVSEDLEHETALSRDSMSSPPTTDGCHEHNTTYAAKHWPQSTHIAHPRPQPTPWRPTILRVAPLAGVAALLLAVLLLLASYAVLAASDGKEVSTWKFEPNVYLAIFTAISNKAVAFALIQGAVVTFWLRLLRGTTLAQVHRDWGYGLFAYKAIVAGRHFNLLALACICATLVAVDGPLLQKSSTIRSSRPNREVTLQAGVVQELPSYFSGFAEPDTNRTSLALESYFNPPLRDYFAGRPLKAIKGCPGSCTARVRGPALAVESCTSSLEYVDFSRPLTRLENTTFNNGNGPPPFNRSIFYTGFGIETGEAEKLLFVTGIAISPGNSTCAANINTTVCRLVSAVAEYPVIIDNDDVKFASPQSYPDIVARANNTALTDRTIGEYGLREYGVQVRTTLAGIAYAAMIQFRTVEYLLPILGGMQEFTPTGVPFNTFSYEHTLVDGSAEHCIAKFSDPRDQIMAGLNEFMFRLGAYCASYNDLAKLKTLLDPGINITSDITGTLTSPVNVFETDFSFFAGAAVVELFTILAVLLTLWGWWNLGRHFSFSPIEIGKAFDAPLLRDLGCHLKGREIVKAEGEREIQYGTIKDEFVYIPDPGHIEEKICIADRVRVDRPSGERLGPKEWLHHLMAKRRSRRDKALDANQADQA